ncbi:hypothetical protein NE865_04372 [Phthorimaea operculella]|nr:hypothetical protein NE865_04372 [Phthorimaea operculella]
MKLMEQFRTAFLLGSNTCPAAQPAHKQELLRPSLKPIFYVKKVVIEPANVGNVEEIEGFLYENYFLCQPTIQRLGINRNSQYLASLAKKYAISGDRWLAYEIEPRLRKRKLIGALAAYKKFPWEADRLKNVADWSPKPESYHLYFNAYCIGSADVFKKYKIPYVYDIEMLSVAKEGHGVEKQLLQTVFKNAFQCELFPLIQVFSTNKCLNAACVDSGMTLEWSKKLADLTDANNNSLFYSNKEQDDTTVNLYIRLFSPKKEHSNYRSDGFVRQNPLRMFHDEHSSNNSSRNHCLGDRYFCETLC